MSLFLIIIDAALEEILLERLKEEGFNEYTKVPKAMGEGESSDPHLDTHVWPGYHVLYLVAVEEERREEMLKLMREMREAYKKRGFKAFILPLHEVI